MEILVYMSLCHAAAVLLYLVCKLFTKNRIPTCFRKWYLRLSLLFLWIPFPVLFSELLPNIKSTFTVDFLKKFNIKSLDGELFWSSNYKYVYLLIGVLVITVLGYIYYLRKYRSIQHYFKKDKESDICNKLSESLNCYDQEIRISNRVDTPAVFGILEPVILLPDESISDEHTKLAIHHEIFHIKQKDLWWNILAIVSAGFHWFNPFVYITLEEIRKINELKCDELVINNLSEEGVRIYIEAILYYSMDEYDRESYFKAAFSYNAREVKRRVHLLYDDQSLKYGKRLAIGLVVFGLCVSCLPALAFQKSTDYILGDDSYVSDRIIDEVQDGSNFFYPNEYVLSDFESHISGEFRFMWVNADDSAEGFGESSLLDNIECKHSFDDGEVYEHVIEGEKCITNLYAAQNCNKCHTVKLAEVITSMKYAQCIHNK